MSDDIIDLGEYLERKAGGTGGRSTFAVWGGEGERSRFALPLWRAVFLAGGTRGGLAWTRDGDPELHPFVVLDLASDPARLELPRRLAAEPPEAGAPALVEREGRGLSVFLGEREGRTWHLVIEGTGEREGALEQRSREDILFLAGECAGLLFYRDLAPGGTAPPDDEA